MQKLTMEILKNFATINNGIIINPGNVLKTTSVTKNIFAEVQLPEEFDRVIPIYDLSEFLSTISLFGEPKVEFTEECIVVKGENSRVKYFYSSPSVIVAPPADKTIKVKDPQITFTLMRNSFDELVKAAGIMKLKEVALGPKGIRVFNKNSVGNQYSADVADLVVSDDASEVVLSVDNLKMIPGNYKVTVGSRVVSFEAVGDLNLKYFVVTEEV